jgi:hypothetical protein
LANGYRVVRDFRAREKEAGGDDLKSEKVRGCPCGSGPAREPGILTAKNSASFQILEARGDRTAKAGRREEF